MPAHAARRINHLQPDAAEKSASAPSFVWISEILREFYCCNVTVATGFNLC